RRAELGGVHGLPAHLHRRRRAPHHRPLLQGAWQRTEDSRLFAICVNDTATLWSVNCRWTHRYEMLGIAVGTPNISQESLDAACLQVVIEALGSSTALDRR